MDHFKGSFHSQCVRSGDPANVEASAARTYWSTAISGGRSPGNGVGINALLDYGYAILRGITIHAICTAGLNPTLGMHHKNRSNPFGLADDLIEPFRPAIDHTAFNLDSTIPLDPDTKHSLVQAVQQPMNQNDETVQTAVHTLATRWAQYVEGHTKTLTVPTWRARNG